MPVKITYTFDPQVHLRILRGCLVQVGGTAAGLQRMAATGTLLPCTLYIVTVLAAQNACLRLNNSVSCIKLRVAKKNYDLRILERASSL